MDFNFINRSQGGHRKRTVTTNDFFESEKNVGYFNSATFKSMIIQMKDESPGLYRQYVNLFNCLKDGFNIRNTITKQTHQVNQCDYYHIRFGKGKMQVETTIYEVEGMGSFINDYANGLIETDFTLAELIKACDNK